jgi:hypothetical protein
MRQYLAEGAQGGFTFLVDRTKPFVTESRPGGSITRMPGRFSVCDCVNGNNRRYGKRVWEKNLSEGSPLQESIKRNAAFGLLEHPSDGRISLLSPISHLVTKANLVESVDAETGRKVYEVQGEIQIVETEEGRKLKALVEAGYNPLVSSRGYGSLQKASDGVDDVLEDYVCESWDVVIKPSFNNAELVPNRAPAREQETAFAEAQKPAAANEVRVVQEQQQTPKAPLPSPAPVAPVSAKPSVTESIMNLNEIKSRIQALRGVNPAINPQRFAESVAETKELHTQIDLFISEDTKSRNYQGTTLHREVEQIERRWNESAVAPAKQAKRLQENNLKLMKVVHATAKTGLTYKSKLGEALTQVKKGEVLVEELTRRGMGWRDLAESRKAKLQEKLGQFDTACEALDIMTERYHRDTVELGRRVIVLEFADKAATPQIQKLLKEANRLKHIAVVRDIMEGRRTIDADGKISEAKEAPAAAAAAAAPAATNESQKDSAGKPVEGAKVNESKTAPAAAAPAAAAAAAPAPVVTEAKVTLTSSTRNPRDVNESIAMVQRMSAATAK